MPIARLQQTFPTRNYPYRARRADDVSPPDAIPPAANTLYRRVVGLDTEPRPMTRSELDGLADPLGRFLRSGKPFPLTTRDLLAAFDALTGADALPDQLVFLVADGGDVPWTTQTDLLERAFRFAIARGHGEFLLLISSSTALDSNSEGAFLQVIGWDAAHEVFHFYERLRGTFFWAGTSRHALEEPTRGQGPFDSHVNGALVMKELRSPWLHWHAPQAGINAEAFAPDDPLLNDPLFRGRVTADRLEIEVVRPAIQRWNAARIRGAVSPDGTWRNVPQFLRQAVAETTVNLATSETASGLLGDDEPLRPPLSFFVNRDVLFDTLELVPDDPEFADIAIPGALYRACLTRYDVHRSDGAIRIDGDSHFAFLTPEPAFEDTNLVDAMVKTGLMTARFAASLAMTDFPNPVFSDRRTALLRYAPGDASGSPPAATMESRFVDAVRRAVAGGQNGADRPESPEQEFLHNWDNGDDLSGFIPRLARFFVRLKAGMSDPEIVDGWFRLAEYRRRRFRERRLAEFALTTPRTNIPPDAAALRMTEQGRVEVISAAFPTV